jgi:hypothetical protein
MSTPTTLRCLNINDIIQYTASVTLPQINNLLIRNEDTLIQSIVKVTLGILTCMILAPIGYLASKVKLINSKDLHEQDSKIATIAKQTLNTQTNDVIDNIEDSVNVPDPISIKEEPNSEATLAGSAVIVEQNVKVDSPQISPNSSKEIKEEIDSLEEKKNGQNDLVEKNTSSSDDAETTNEQKLNKPQTTMKQRKGRRGR